LISGQISKNGEVKQENKLYEEHGGWKPKTMEDLAGPKMSGAFMLLLKIYESKDKQIISAAFTTLTALARAATDDDKKNNSGNG